MVKCIRSLAAPVALLACTFVGAEAHATAPVDLIDPITPTFENYTDQDLVFAFVTPLGQEGLGQEGNDEANAQPEEPQGFIEDGDLLSGADILSRLDQSEEEATRSLLTDQALTAFFSHPISGKSVELQIAHCASLDFDTADGPFAQQVLCGEDRYAYAAGTEGIDILLNGEVFFTLPLDEGHYRLNGVDMDIK